MTSSHDRREFLRRAGLGAAAAGAWVAPQVLSSGVAHAGCTPVTRCLQVTASGCSGSGMTSSPLGTCLPSGCSVGGSTPPVSWTCGTNSVTITTAGCTIVDAVAVKSCSGSGGPALLCVTPSSMTATTVTFPTLVAPPTCTYLVYRLSTSCCT